MMKENLLSLIISIGSTLLAVFSLLVSWYTLDEQKRINQITNNYALLAQTNELIAEFPELLQLHNVDPEDLVRIGVTETDVLYVMQSIYAAQSFYEVGNEKKVDYRKFTPYRRNFLDNPKVEAIWKNVMRDKLMSGSPLTQAIDDYYANK